MNFLSLLDESDQFLSKSQDLLVRALLQTGFQSDLNAKNWAESIDFDLLDAASFRLIPALYSRCGKSDALKAYSGRMKGIYRKFFYRNHKLIARTRQTLALLSDHDIEFIIFKGTSILIQHHDSVALRSFSDCDILVREQDRERAEKLIQDDGWSYVYQNQSWRTDLHSRDYKDGAHAGFDLHWYALYECCESGIDDGFWQRSRQLDWDGLKVRVLSPEDELLVAACNGIRDRANPQLDWLYDASLIFEATPVFDWGLVAAEARARHLGDEFVTALALLNRYVPAFRPAEVEQHFQPEISNGLVRMLAQNRNFGFDMPTSQRIKAAIRSQEPVRPEQNENTCSDTIAQAASSRQSVKFVHFELDDDGWVRHLRFYRSLLDYIPDIFEMHDEAAFDELAFFVSDLGEVRVQPNPGTLRVPENPRFDEYDAAISMDESDVTFHPLGARQTQIPVTITNSSPSCWRVFPDQRHTVGLSYHLMYDDGTVLEWDMPRLDLLPRRRSHATVLLPGGSLEVKYTVLRPPGTGTFHADFDIVHEHVSWFAETGCSFPSLKLEAP